MRTFSSVPKKGLAVLALFCFQLVACDSNETLQKLSISGATMGTSYHIHVVTSRKLSDKAHQLGSDELSALVDDYLLKINQQMSTYIADSELSLFNKSPTDSWYPVSAELCEVLTLAQQVSRESGGRFDVTVGALVNLWGFGPEDHRGVPGDEAIAHAKSRVGYDKLELDCPSSRIRKTADIYVDLSAIAKGYAVDQIGNVLQRIGFDNYMVEIGGELRLAGHNAEGGPWRIAVEKPVLERAGAQQILQLSGYGLATSGDYRNYYEVDGVRISHTIDPVSAAPIRHKLASVTVVAESSAKADAWATAMNVAGLEEAKLLAYKHGLHAYFIVNIDGAFVVDYTENFQSFMVQ